MSSKIRHKASERLKELKRPYFGCTATIIIEVILIGYAITLIYPFLWLFINSLKTLKDYMFHSFSFPQAYEFSNYVKAWQDANISRYFLNSVIYTVIITALTLYFSSTFAYVLAKYKFKGKKFLYCLLIVGFLIPSLGTFASWYKFMSDAHLFNPLGYIINSASGINSTALIMYAYFRGIPDEYLEAAQLDGAGHFRTYFMIMMPLAKPGLATMGMMSLINFWNDYFIPSILIKNTEQLPIAVALQTMVMNQQYRSEWTVLFAAVIITALPMIVIFICLKDFIMKGFSMSLK